jgi:hypothetical protein
MTDPHATVAAPPPTRPPGSANATRADAGRPVRVAVLGKDTP